MERIAMSQEERDWLDWLKRAKRREDDAAGSRRADGRDRALGAEVAAADEETGRCRSSASVAGAASNRKLPAKTQKQALAILRKPEWHDFGPTFAAEQLAKYHQIQVGKETLRGWMIAAGMWQPGSRRIRTCTAGGHGAAGSANWCSGTHPSTIGWKAAGRCVIWCG
jgi:hypothetical protein